VGMGEYIAARGAQRAATENVAYSDVYLLYTAWWHDV